MSPTVLEMPWVFIKTTRQPSRSSMQRSLSGQLRDHLFAEQAHGPQDFVEEGIEAHLLSQLRFGAHLLTEGLARL